MSFVLKCAFKNYGSIYSSFFLLENNVILLYANG